MPRHAPFPLGRLGMTIPTQRIKSYSALHGHVATWAGQPASEVKLLGLGKSLAYGNY